ncbi:hypothetical protein B0H67DRAFT_660538 [Lasiosphaeris hirsuta]|uniref:Uncharacterized protein n=1 Tax=Lasiosphaeris hirsuta TaxID=260670 RepID=A0AA40DWP9_9PEZI|nr:hypothetical protein B0H67DRAFT_660538 [Lasiosphaeris hirsuta]
MMEPVHFRGAGESRIGLLLSTARGNHYGPLAERRTANSASKTSRRPFGNIHRKLLDVALDGAPGYEAISYTGGRWRAQRGTFTESPAFTGHTLESLLGTFADFKSTLPVDKIYGLLSLLPPPPPDYVSSADWLTPNYTQPAHLVYTTTAKHLIQTNPSNILSWSGIGYPRNIPALPSWVPDWTSLSLADTTRQHFANFQASSRYNASASSTPKISFIPSSPSPILTIQGHILDDQILHLGPIHKDTAHNKGEGALTPQEMAAVVRPHITSRKLAVRYVSDPYSPTGRPLEEAFWRTLVGDTDYRRPADAHLGLACRV